VTEYELQFFFGFLSIFGKIDSLQNVANVSYFVKIDSLQNFANVSFFVKIDSQKNLS